MLQELAIGDASLSTQPVAFCFYPDGFLAGIRECFNRRASSDVYRLVEQELLDLKARDSNINLSALTKWSAITEKARHRQSDLSMREYEAVGRHDVHAIYAKDRCKGRYGPGAENEEGRRRGRLSSKGKVCWN